MALLVRVAAAASAGLSAWLALGVVAIAPDTTSASRIGLLPPVWWLLGLVAGAVAIVAGLRWSVPRCLPLFGTLACALPWLPGAIPAALLTWQGPLAAVVWIGTIVAVAAAAPLPWPPSWRGPFTHPVRAPLVAGGLAALTFLVAWRGVAAWIPGGDEPHYLVITQSLLRDGDLRVENNYQRKDYAAYLKRPGPLAPHYLRRGIDGEIYSIHAPGIPVFVLPAFALAGYPGVVVWLIVCVALGTALAWRLAWEVTRSASAAWVGWAAVALSLPVVVQAFTVYPDGLAGVLTLVATWGAWRAHRSSVALVFATGLALAVLPWLHARTVLIAGMFGVVVAVRLWLRRDRVRALSAFAAAPLVSAIGWLAYFRVIYGSFSPSAPYGGYTQTALEHLPEGLAGLLLDQQYGLLAAAPVLLAAAVGLVAMLTARTPLGSGDASPRRLAIDCLVVTLPYVLFTATYRMWWGGTSAPARFLVPILLPLAVPAAWAWMRSRRFATRALYLALLTLTLVQTIARTWAGDGLLAITVRGTYGPFWEWATRAVDLSMALPGVLRDGLQLPLRQAAIWLGAALLGWVAMWPSRVSRVRLAALAVPLGVACCSLALAVSWAVADVAPLRVEASRHAAWLRAGPGWHAVTYRRFQVGERRHRSGWLSLEDALSVLEVSRSHRTPVPEAVLVSVAPVPAGRYRVLVRLTGAGTGSLQVAIASGSEVALRDVEGLPVASDGRRFLDLLLPIPVRAVTVTAHPGDVARAGSLVPIALLPVAHGTSTPALMARRYSEVTAFFPTDAQYPEPGGLWVKAGGDVPIVLAAPPETRTLLLLVRNGPRPNEARVDWQASRLLRLAPHEETVLELPWPTGAESARLVVHAAAAFRPADEDPASADTRRLGVWLQFDRR